ncbi:LuxR C-terminal-related transcriptional regulator [Schumannella luteola]
MTELPRAGLAWAGCFDAGADERAGILALPTATWQSDASTLLRLAASHRGGNATPGLSLEYVAAAAQCEGAPPWAAPVGAVLRSDALRALGRGAEAAAALDDARSALDSRGIDLGDRLRLSGVVHVREGIAAALSSDFPTAIAALERGRELVPDLPAVHAEATGMLALIAFLVGRLDDSRALLATIRADGGGTALLPAAATDALLAIETGAAESHLETIAAAQASAAGTEYRALLTATHAVALEAAGRPDGVTRTLWELDGAAGSGDATARFLGLSAWLAVQAGARQISPALASLEGIEPDPAHSVCPAAWRARLYLETGDCHRALAELAPCVGLGPGHAMRTLVYVLAVSAAAYAGLRDMVSADEAFARALDLAALTGLRRYIVTLPPAALAELLGRAAGAGLPEASRRVVADVAGMLPPDPTAPQPLLSPRERLVLRHLAEGESQHRIAWLLSVSHNTVKTQIRSVYRKLEVDSRQAAVERGRMLGFVE